MFGNKPTDLVRVQSVHALLSVRNLGSHQCSRNAGISIRVQSVLMVVMTASISNLRIGLQPDGLLNL